MNDAASADFAQTLACHLRTEVLGRPLYFFPTLDSTNTYAARLARDGAPEGTVVIADMQTGGKGRLGRTWVSPPRVNLYLSVILRPAVSIATAPSINLLAGVAVAETIASVCGLTPAIKWPNDVLVNDKKVCGILAEMQAAGSTLHAVILGIGVNLNAPLSAFPEELRGKASSLSVVSGRRIERSLFTAALLTSLEKFYVLWLQQGFSAVRAEWERYAADLLGKTITVAAAEGTVTGVVLGLDADGALLVRTDAEATPRRLLAGDVTVVGGYQRGVKP